MCTVILFIDVLSATYGTQLWLLIQLRLPKFPCQTKMSLKVTLYRYFSMPSHKNLSRKGNICSHWYKSVVVVTYYVDTKTDPMREGPLKSGKFTAWWRAAKQEATLTTQMSSSSELSEPSVKRLVSLVSCEHSWEYNNSLHHTICCIYNIIHCTDIIISLKTRVHFHMEVVVATGNLYRNL